MKGTILSSSRIGLLCAGNELRSLSDGHQRLGQRPAWEPVKIHQSLLRLRAAEGREKREEEAKARLKIRL
jgi:hypothetical protein